MACAVFFRSQKCMETVGSFWKCAPGSIQGAVRADIPSCAGSSSGVKQLPQDAQFPMNEAIRMAIWLYIIYIIYHKYK